MRITFGSVFLRDVCEDYEKACEEYGLEKALILFSRLSDIEASTFINDIRIGRLDIINKNDIIQIIYYLTKDEDIYISFEIPQNKKLIDDFINFEKLSRVKLTNIKL